MADEYDKVRKRFKVTFCEEEAFYFIKTGAGSVTGLKKTRRKSIKNKWLYIFWHEGSCYEEYNGPKYQDARFSRKFAMYAGQHMAILGTGKSKNPPRTKGKLEAENIWREVWFDENGFLYPIDISKEYKQPRYKRRDPVKVFERRLRKSKGSQKDKVPQKDMWLPLKLGGKPVRYYFLLSSVRLGPKALEACLKEGATDGMSIWCRRTGKFAEDTEISIKNEVWGPTAELLKDLTEGRKYKQSKHYLRCLGRIGAVDPYHFAEDINTHHYIPTLNKYAEFLSQIERGMPPKGKASLKRHLEKSKNKGSLDDLYFIAKTLLALDGRDKGKNNLECKWDHWGATEVVRLVERELMRMRNSCEQRAQFVCNWLGGPAHGLIDIAVTQDTKQDGDPAAAAHDRAYGLQHWYNVTTFLGFTSNGSAFMANLSGKDPNNPVQSMLMKYRQDSKKLDRNADTVTFDTFCLVCTILPDLCLRWLMMDMQDGAMKNTNPYAGLAQKATAVMNVMNNIGYFPNKIGRTPKERAGAYKTVSEYINHSVFLTEQMEKIPEALVDIYTSPKFNQLMRRLQGSKWFGSHFRTLSKWADSHATSLWRSYELGGKAQAPVPYFKLFLALTNLLFVQGNNARALGDSKQSTVKRLEAAGELVLAGAAVFESIMDLAKIDKISWQKYAKVRATRGAFAARAGVALSIIAIICAVWIVYTNLKAAATAWANRDRSVVIGAGIAVFGGALLAVHGIAVLAGVSGGLATTGVGVIAAILIFVGGLIVLYTTDTPFQIFVNSSYFAEEVAHRNYRRFSGGNDHWAGPKLKTEWKVNGHKRNWPVVHQQAALCNLISRFTFSTKARTAGRGAGTTCKLHWLTLTIKYIMIPKGSEFIIDFKGPDRRHRGKRILCRVTFTPDADAKGRVRSSPDQRGTWRTRGPRSNEIGTSHTIWISNITNWIDSSLDVEVTLYRPDGSLLKLEHNVLTVTRAPSGAYGVRNLNPMGPPPTIMNVNGKVSGPAEKFGLLRLPTWKG